METLLYLIKVNVAIASLYVAYRLLSRGDTLLRWKRYILLTITGVAFAYPLLPVGGNVGGAGSPAGTNLLPVYYLNEVDVVMGETAPAAPFPTSRLALTCYGLVAAIFLARLLARVFVVLGIARATRRGPGGSRVKEGLRSPFSFFAWIVLDPDRYAPDELEHILLHERAHARQGHSFDILLAEITCALCWFNPFAWAMRGETRANLEYLADRAVLDAGRPADAYQSHLLRLSRVPVVVALTNNFNVSLLKKRIMMMNKKQTSVAGAWKYALLIPTFALLALFHQTLKAETRTSSPAIADNTLAGGVFDVSEQLPTFPAYLTSPVRDSAKWKVSVKYVDKNPRDSSMKVSVKYVDKNPRDSSVKVSVRKIHGDSAVVVRATAKGEVLYTATATSQANKGEVLYTATSQAKTPTIAADTITGDVFEVVEQLPTFPGDHAALAKFLHDNLRYPASLARDSVDKRVFVEFIVGADGKVRNAKIARSFNADCDAEALRVVNAMPAWNPGKQRGQNVNVRFFLPVIFREQVVGAGAKPR
jgi:TonB family protein